LKGIKLDIIAQQILGGYEIRNKLKDASSILDIKQLLMEEGGPLALIIDQDKYRILANDHLGTLPVFYDGEGAAFDPARLKRPISLPPGSTLIKKIHGKGVIKRYIGPNVERGGTFEELLIIINKYIELLPERGLAIAFSGGLDSSLLAWLARRKKPLLFTAGTDESQDLVNARIAAGKMGMSYDTVKVTELEVKEAYRKIYKTQLTTMDKALAVGFYLISHRAAKEGAKLLVVGQLADELFGGYKRYFALSRADLNAVLKHDVYSSTAGLIRDSLAVLRGGIEPNFPYSHRKLVNMVLGMEPQTKIYDGMNKIALREMGKLATLPDSIINAKKRAFQYGSGILKYIIKLGL